MASGLSTSGDTGSRLCEVDWADTSLGPLATWPERIRAVVDLVLASPLVASVALGPERRLIYNDAAARLYGDRHPGAFGRPLALACPVLYPALAPLYDRVFAGEAVRVDAQSLTMGGQDAVFDAYLTPVRDAAGAVIGAHLIGLEIGERVRAEAALREREADLMRVQRIGRVGGIDVDVAHGLVSRRSPEFLRLHGLGPEGLRETHADWRARVHPDDVDEAERRLFAALTGTASSYESEYRIIRPSDGAIRWIHARADIERDTAGAAVRMVGAHLDVTDQKRMQEALHVSEARQAVLLALSDALRPLADPEAIASTACRILVRHMRASRAQIAELSGEPGGEMGEHLAEHVERSEPMPRRYPLAAFGAALAAALRAGRSWVLDDAARDPRLSGEERRLFAAAHAPAAIAVPLVRQGRLVATFAIHDTRPRAWNARDVAFVEDVAERSWAAIERARAEAAVRDSEAWLAAAFESVPVGIAIIDTAGRAIRSNAEFRRFLPANIIPSRDPRSQVRWRAWDARGRPLAPEQFPAARALRGETVVPGQEVLYTDDAGREIWTAVATAPVRDDGGRVSGVVSVISDIDAAKRTGERLRESEERQRLTVELVPALLWSTSPDGRDVSLNEGWSAYTGQSGAEMQDGGWLDPIHPDDLPATRAAFAHAFASGEPLERRHRIHKAGNGHRWHLVRHVPVRDAGGAIVRWFGAAVDIHESTLAAQALDESERRLQTLIEGVPQLVWRATDPGRWTWASPQWTHYTGQAERDSHDWGWLDPVHPDDRDRVRAIWATANERGAFEADYRICYAAEERYRWFQTRAMPARDDHGRIMEWLGTSTDVDDLRRLQQRQEVLVAELQHRTRNLMGVVRATADRTGEASADLADFRLRFQDRLEALARVQALLSRLSDTDRIAFDELIHTEIAAMHGSGDRVTLHGPSGIRLRSGMVQTLAMALHELATNAVKYGALGQADGHLDIAWRMVEPDRHGHPRLRIDWRESGVVMPPLGAAPQGGGQGRELIEQALPYQLSAETLFELGPDGVRCTITLPVSTSTAEDEDGG